MNVFKVIIGTLIILEISSCKTEKVISGKYFTNPKDNSVESGTLTINQSETRFTYEWKEHLTGGLTHGKIEKENGSLRITSFIDTLKNKEAIIVRKRVENSNLSIINFYTIDSLRAYEVVFTLFKGNEKSLLKSDSLGVFSINNFIGEISVNQSLEFEAIKFSVDYRKDNLISVFLIPNTQAIQYKHFKNEEYKFKGKSLKSTSGNRNFYR